LAKPKFEDVLLESIDECLGSLGESSRIAVHFYQRSYKIRSADIAESVGAFTQALVGIFGVGADYLEALTRRILLHKAELIGENSFEQISFSQALLSVKKEMEC
jgi:hypothetical protein